MVERGREMSYIESRMVYQENKKIQIKKKNAKKKMLISQFEYYLMKGIYGFMSYIYSPINKV